MFTAATGTLTGLATLLASVAGGPGHSEPEAKADAPVYSQIGVRAACQKGGHITFTVDRLDTTYRLTATARGVKPGTRWVGGLETHPMNDDGTKSQDQPIDVTATDGHWRAVAEFDQYDSPYFVVYAFKPGVDNPYESRLCDVFLIPDQPFGAVASCRQPGRQIMAATMRRGENDVVRWSLTDVFEPLSANARWTVEAEASTDTHTSSVTTTAAPRGKAGLLTGKATYGGLHSPDLHVAVSSSRGSSCSIDVRRELAVR